MNARAHKAFAKHICITFAKHVQDLTFAFTHTFVYSQRYIYLNIIHISTARTRAQIHFHKTYFSLYMNSHNMLLIFRRFPDNLLWTHSCVYNICKSARSRPTHIHIERNKNDAQFTFLSRTISCNIITKQCLTYAYSHRMFIS